MSRLVEHAVVATGPRGNAAREFELRAHEFTPFHRLIAASETWELREGGPVEIHVIHADGRHEARRLALDSGVVRSETIEPGALRAARLAPGAGPARGVRHAWPPFAGFASESPTAQEILREHPLHETIVYEFTRC